MKAHIGADLESGVVHTVVGTAANVSDISQTHALLHGAEQVVLADAGYLGVEKRAEVQAAHPTVSWQVAAKRQTVKQLPEGKLKKAIQAFEKCKASLRAVVEHPFHVLKNIFHLGKPATGP